MSLMMQAKSPLTQADHYNMLIGTCHFNSTECVPQENPVHTALTQPVVTQHTTVSSTRHRSIRDSGRLVGKAKACNRQ